MKKLLTIFFLFCSPSFATTTVTGVLKTLGTTNSTGGFVRFWLRGCAGNQPRVAGTGIIAPSQGGVFYFDFPTSSSGLVSGTLYSTRDVTGTTNGEIECGGSLTAVWYGMQVFSGGKGGPETPIAANNTATIDVSNVTPITTTPVVPSPTGDNTYLRLDGGNSPVTGPVSFMSTQTTSGLATFNGGATFTGLVTIPEHSKGFLNVLTDGGAIGAGAGCVYPGTGNFVGTGCNDDGPAIQALINANPGRHIILPKLIAPLFGGGQEGSVIGCDYVSSVPLILSGNGMTLEGDITGKPWNSKVSVCFLPLVSGQNEFVDPSNCTGCGFKNLYAFGPYANEYGGNASIIGLGDTSHAGSGFYISGGHPILENVAASSSGQSGVTLNGTNLVQGGVAGQPDFASFFNIMTNANAGFGEMIFGQGNGQPCGDANAGMMLGEQSYSNQMGGIEELSCLGNTHNFGSHNDAHNSIPPGGPGNGGNSGMGQKCGTLARGSNTATCTTDIPTELGTVGRTIIVSGSTAVTNSFNGIFTLTSIDNGAAVNITSTTVTSNVLTVVFASGTFVGGEVITFAGLTTKTYLNQCVETIVTMSGSTATFNLPSSGGCSSANYGVTADTGTGTSSPSKSWSQTGANETATVGGGTGDAFIVSSISCASDVCSGVSGSGGAGVTANTFKANVPACFTATSTGLDGKCFMLTTADTSAPWTHFTFPCVNCSYSFSTTGDVYVGGSWDVFASVNRLVTDAVCTSGSNILTSNTALWSAPANVGKSITVKGCGAAGGYLTTTISSLNNPYEIVMGANASTSQPSGTSAQWDGGFTVGSIIANRAGSARNIWLNAYTEITSSPVIADAENAFIGDQQAAMDFVTPTSLPFVLGLGSGVTQIAQGINWKSPKDTNVARWSFQPGLTADQAWQFNLLDHLGNTKMGLFFGLGGTAVYGLSPPGDATHAAIIADTFDNSLVLRGPATVAVPTPGPVELGKGNSQDVILNYGQGGNPNTASAKVTTLGKIQSLRTDAGTWFMGDGSSVCPAWYGPGTGASVQLGFVANCNNDPASFLYSWPQSGPATSAMPYEATGTAASLTGTGACATITTQHGGSWAGDAKCTGTTGASTITITPGVTALNGWVCYVQDETTRANLFQQTSHSTTSCTLTITSVTQNDVFVFSAVAY